MYRDRNFSFVMLSVVLCTSMLVLSGCGQQQSRRAGINAYVDAVMYQQLAENDKAVEKLNEAVEYDPQFSLAHSLLGQIYQLQGQYEKSAAAYTQATELNPFSFKDFFNLGKVQQIMEAFAKAVEAYVRACQLRPDHIESHLNTAKCYYEIENFDSALKYGKQAQALAEDTNLPALSDEDEPRPNEGEIQKVLGDIYNARREPNEAILAYKRALEFDPDLSGQPDIMMSLAIAYLRIGRNETAKELLNSTIELEPQNSQAYQYLGYCHLRLIRPYDEKLAELTKAMENPKNDQVPESRLVGIKKDYSDVLDAKLAEIGKAIQKYVKAIQINPKDHSAHKGLGVAYMLASTVHKDDSLSKKAIQQWKVSLDIEPEQPKLLKLLKKYDSEN